MVERATQEAVDLLAFPDHHPFGAEDARRISAAAAGRSVVVTEKDAVKLQALSALLPPVRVLPLTVRPEHGAHALEEALARIVRKAGAAAGPPARAGSPAPGAPAGGTTGTRSAGMRG